MDLSGAGSRSLNVLVLACATQNLPMISGWLVAGYGLGAFVGIENLVAVLQRDVPAPEKFVRFFPALDKLGIGRGLLVQIIVARCGAAGALQDGVAVARHISNLQFMIGRDIWTVPFGVNFGLCSREQ